VSMELGMIFVPWEAGYGPAVRQFGLNLLESIVKRLGQGEASHEQGILQQIWSLAMGVNGLRAEGESRAMKEKMAGVLVQAALRVWPQRWPGLFDQLLGECGCMATPSGPSSPRQALNADLAISVIRMLVEEVQQASDADVSAAGWNEERRQELHAALTSQTLPGFTAWLWGVLPMAAQRSRPNDATSMALLSAVVRAWGAVVGSVALPADSTPMAVGTLFNLAQVYEDPVRGESLDALHALSIRNARTGDHVLFAQLLDQEAERLQQLLTILAKQAEDQDGDWEDSYGHLKRTAEILVNIATLCIAHRRHPALPKRHLGPILRLLLDLLGLPSLLIKSLATLFWSASLKSGKAEGNFPDILNAEVLPALFMRVLTALAADKRSERQHAWNRADFDTDLSKEYEEVRSATCNRLTCLLEGLAGRNAAGSLELMAGAMAAFCSDPGNAASLRSGASRADSQFTVQWAALSLACDALCRGIVTAKISTYPAPHAASARRLLDALVLSPGVVDMQTSSPDTLLHWLTATRALSVLLANDKEGSCECLPAVLVPGMLGLSLGYTSSGEEGAMQVRNRAGALLLKLASLPPAGALFSPHLEQLASALEDTTSDSSAPMSVQRQRLLTELLLTLSLSSGVDWMDRAVRPLLTSLEQAQPFLASSQAVKQAVVGPNGLLVDSSEFRRSLSNLLALLFIVASRLSDGAGGMALEVSDYVRGTVAPRLCSALLSLLIALQSLRSRVAWNDIPDGHALWNELFAKRQSDTTNVLATFHPLQSCSSQSDPLATLRGWFSTVTVSALVSLGLLTRTPGFFASPRQLDAWTPLLAGCDPATASPWALTWLLKHAVHPLMLAAHENADDEVRRALSGAAAFNAALDQFLPALALRLHTEWRSIDTVSSNGTASLQEEMERESELVMLSTATLSLLYDTLFPAAERMNSNKTQAIPTAGNQGVITRSEPFLDLTVSPPLPPPPPTTAPTALWLATANPDRMLTVLRMAVMALGWRPAAGTGRAFVIASRWIPVWCQHPSIPHSQLYALLFEPSPSTDIQSMMGVCLMTLGMPARSDLHQHATSLVAELYKWAILLRVETPSLEPCLSTLPSCSPHSLSVFRAALLDPTRASAKSHREASRSFFKPMQSASASLAAGRTACIPKLPEKLVLMKRLKEAEPEVSAEDIDALFS